MAAGRVAGGTDPEQLMRLDRFRRTHRNAVIKHNEFGDWEAVIQRGNRERFLARPSLHWLLDDAETIYAGGDPRAHPD